MSSLADFIAAIGRRGVHAKPLYSSPLYRHPIFVNRASPYRNEFPFNLAPERYEDVLLPGVEEACAWTVWFPINPTLAVERYRCFGAVVRAVLSDA